MVGDAAERRWSVAKAAEFVGCHQETIRRAIRSGELKAARDRLSPGGPLLIRDSDFRAFLAIRRPE